ncbi:MAG: hypothetical protein JWP89_2626 [Schlesneria sp.]|nr:hypothetical protein [Schlesneria sp.]
MDEEGVQKAANALLRLPSVPVLKALAVVWTVALVMVFTMLLTIRFALSIPL